MNENVWQVPAEERERMKTAVSALVQKMAQEGLTQYLCAMTEMTAERLVQIGEGEAGTAAEVLAMVETVRLMGQVSGDETMTTLAAQAVETILPWGKCVYGTVSNALGALREPVSDTGMGTASAFLGKFHIFFDASVLCSPHMPAFLDKVLPLLLTERKFIHTFSVPETVVRYLNEQAADSGFAVKSGGTRGIAQLTRLQEAGLLTVRGDDMDTTMRSTFLSAFARFKPKYRLLLLTEDAALARAVFFLNMSGLEGEEVVVARLRDGGIMNLWRVGEAMAAVATEKRDRGKGTVSAEGTGTGETAAVNAGDTEKQTAYDALVESFVALYRQKNTPVSTMPKEEAFWQEEEVPFPGADMFLTPMDTATEESLSPVLDIAVDMSVPEGEMEAVNIESLLFTPETKTTNTHIATSLEPENTPAAVV